MRLGITVIARFTEAAAAQIERDREQGVAPPGAEAHRLAGVLIAMNERAFYYAVSAGDPGDDVHAACLRGRLTRG